MRPDPRFVGQPKSFWACVRTLSQWIGYTERGKGIIRVYSVPEIQGAFRELELNAEKIISRGKTISKLGHSLHGYFQYRAEVLNNFVKPRLMDLAQAKEVFKTISSARPHSCPVPMNKQKDEKRAKAFLTGITNMLIEENLNGLPCNYDPRALTTVTKAGVPLRTLSRRVDGAFPDAINPIAIWEIKEYYYTRTFGSRVADAVYETLLDGMELEELALNEKIEIKHYLILDDFFTWWECGRSYLCRVVDLLHMGYVDEVLFGREVVERIPQIVKEWVDLYENRAKMHIPEPRVL